jgi:hypothetical protein
MSNAADYLAGINDQYPGLLATSEGRRRLTRTRPKLFALVYLNHHLHDESTHGLITFGEQHDDWYRHMLAWMKPTTQPRQWRKAFVAPRSSAKSTVWFLVAPLWAAAHDHARFVAAFGDNAGIAERHLQTFKNELDTNDLLRRDFPDLCRPRLRPTGFPVSDSRQMIVQHNGFVFSARGITGTSLGLKVGNRRPDVLILDDIEPQAEEYSAGLMEKRLDTVQNAVLPMNANARVVLVGTVTMDGSLIHQLVQSVTSTNPPSQWIVDERFECIYYPALSTAADGSPKSIWPEKWPVSELVELSKTRAFAIQFQNLPLPANGAYWSTDDIAVELPDEDVLARCMHLLSVDPAVTSKTISDATGVAWLSFDPRTGIVYVRDVWQFRLTPKALRFRVEQIL